MNAGDPPANSNRVLRISSVLQRPVVDDRPHFSIGVRDLFGPGRMRPMTQRERPATASVSHYPDAIAERNTDPESRTQAWLSVATRLMPGIGRVHAQAAPFALAWQSANIQALHRDGPLWVALGDSMSQGIGARDIAGGWVGQLRSRMTTAGQSMRLVNLSETGARVHNVLHDQLPQVRDLAI